MTAPSGVTLLAITLAFLNLALLALLARRIRHQHQVLEMLAITAGTRPCKATATRLVASRDPVEILHGERP